MKKIMMMMAMMMAMTVTANAMSYKVARNEALFLSDKMAYELNLTDAQYNAVYEINLDYFLMVDSRADVRGIWWDRRNTDLKYVLTAWQYEKFASLNYFFTPVTWRDGSWTFGVYTVYSNRNHFFKGRPTVFVDYRGGNNHKDVHFYAGWNGGRPPVANNNNGTWRNTNNGNHGNVNVNNVRPGHNGSNNNGLNNNGHNNNVHNNNNGTRGHGTASPTVAKPTSRVSGSFGAGRR